MKSPEQPGGNPFVALREAVAECLRQLGAVGTVEIRGLDVLLDDETIPIRFPNGARLDDTDRVIVEAIRSAGKPLQQKEIAEAGDLGIRTVQDRTPALVKRGVLLKHPSQGFYVVGMRGVDFPP